MPKICEKQLDRMIEKQNEIDSSLSQDQAKHISKMESNLENLKFKSRKFLK